MYGFGNQNDDENEPNTSPPAAPPVLPSCGDEEEPLYVAPTLSFSLSAGGATSSPLSVILVQVELPGV